TARAPGRRRPRSGPAFAHMAAAGGALRGRAGGGGMKDPQASFSADWLRQREPFDRAARNGAAGHLRLPTRLSAFRPPQGVPWRVIDLACGTGANLRWLAPVLGGEQEWLMLDHDAALLQRLPSALS